MIFSTVPSGRSWRNSNAAVSFSMNEILMKSKSSVARHNSAKSSLLSVAKNDLVSCSEEVFMLANVEILETNMRLGLQVYG